MWCRWGHHSLSVSHVCRFCLFVVSVLAFREQREPPMNASPSWHQTTAFVAGSCRKFPSLSTVRFVYPTSNGSDMKEREKRRELLRYFSPRRGTERPPRTVSGSSLACLYDGYLSMRPTCWSEPGRGESFIYFYVIS